MSRRQLRHLGLATFVTLACLLALALTERTAPTVVLSLGLGYASLALLVLALATGPWVVARGGRMPVSTMFRRDVGIWAAISGSLHVVFGLQSHLGGDILGYFVPDSWGRGAFLFVGANWIGAAATGIVLGLLALSNNVSLRVLGPERWKAWQRSAYLLGALVIVHTLAYQLVEQRGKAAMLATTAVAAVVVVLQLRGFFLTRRR